MKQYIKINLDKNMKGTLELHTNELVCTFEVEDYSIVQISDWVVEMYPVTDALEILYMINTERFSEGRALVYEYEVLLLEEGEEAPERTTAMSKYYQEAWAKIKKIEAMEDELLDMINSIEYTIRAVFAGVYTEIFVKAKDLKYNLYDIDVDRLEDADYDLDEVLIGDYIWELKNKGFKSIHLDVKYNR